MAGWGDVLGNYLNWLKTGTSPDEETLKRVTTGTLSNRDLDLARAQNSAYAAMVPYGASTVSNPHGTINPQPGTRGVDQAATERYIQDITGGLSIGGLPPGAQGPISPEYGYQQHPWVAGGVQLPERSLSWDERLLALMGLR